MARELLSRRYFWLPYGLALAAIVVIILAMADALPQAVMMEALFGGLMAAAIAVSVYGLRHSFSGLTVPERYSPQHYLLAFWHSVQTGALAFGLHGALYALFWHLACRLVWGHVCAGDEPVFFIVLLFVVPAGFILSAVGRLWEWAVVRTVREIEAEGIRLPDSARYFTPIGSYVWLWKFSKGVAMITRNRVTAGGAFCAVFFLGVIGFFIIRGAVQYHAGKRQTT
jgi:hypothetical protein